MENKEQEKNDSPVVEYARQLIVKEKRKKDKGTIRSGRWLISGLLTIILIIIIIDVYILINILLNKVTLPEIDLTENKVYSLSEETDKKLGSLEDKVTLTFINYTDNDSVVKLGEKYVILNENINVELIGDLVSRKDIMEEYSLESTDQLIVISSGDNKTTLNEYDLCTYDYSTYETIDTTEEAITNAILDITTEDKPKIYFMNNHAEYEIETYFYTIKTSIKEDANEVDTLDILTAGGVPEDCDTLVITTLSEDVTLFEKDKIIEYINKGGELLILNGSDITGKNLTNYQAILDLYGITMEKGVIFEGSSSNMLYGYPDFIIEEVDQSSLTEDLNMNLSVCLPDAAAIRFNQEKSEELNVEYEPIVNTTEGSFIRTDLTVNSSSRTSSDSEAGEFVVGAMVNKKIDENNSSKLIIFGNEMFASDMQVQLSGYTYQIAELYNNADVVLNSVAYLNEREDIITIRKSYDTVTYTATEFQHNIIMAIIFILPLVIIVIGIIIWQIRRKK